MISIDIHNYRGVELAQVRCNPLGLVAGRNAAGKSSLAQGVGITLCGEVPSSLRLGRNPGAAVVRSGAGGALIEIEDEQGIRRMEFPKAQGSQSGDPPTASKWAAGLVSPVELSGKELAEVMSAYLRAMPTEEDVAEELKKHRLDQHAEALWDLIERQGWEATERQRRERGAEMKGAWGQLTNAHYGSRIAQTYRPDLAELNESDLIGDVKRAEIERDRAIAAAAVSQEERQRLMLEIHHHQARKDALIKAEGAVEEADKATAIARNQRDALPPATQPRYVPCPYCDGPLEVIRDLATVRLEKATGEIMGDDELKRRRNAIADAEGKWAHANDELNRARRALAEAQRATAASEEAQARLDKWPRATESGTDLDGAKAALSRAEKRLAEFRTKIEADTIHHRIEINEVVIGMLAGDGLRRQKLESVLHVFNQTMLQELTEWAGWDQVVVGRDMTITYAGRAYGLLSASEQYRVRVVLQIAMARIEGADLIVIDGADILDAPARSGLALMLNKIGINALVCMTASKPDQVPDLARMEMGTTYWIQDGVTQERVAA